MKALKKIGCILAAGVMAIGASALVACGGEEDATAYNVYFKDASGNALANITVGICSYVDGEKDACYNPVTTDENGKAVFTNEVGSYVINEGTLEDEGYLVVQGGYENNILTAYGDYTITLIAE